MDLWHFIWIFNLNQKQKHHCTFSFILSFLFHFTQANNHKFYPNKIQNIFHSKSQKYLMQTPKKNFIHHSPTLKHMYELKSTKIKGTICSTKVHQCYLYTLTHSLFY